MTQETRRQVLAPHIASAIDRFIPSHVQQSFPDLVAFIEAYFGYLETSNLSGYYQNTLQYQRDIRTQDKAFLQQIERELGLFVPREYEATPLLFYDRISDLWRSKGSEVGIETFFRLILKDTVQIRYPWDRVLKPSDGIWNEPQKLRIAIIEGDPDDFDGQRVQQIEDYGLATVSKIERRPYADITIYELSLVRGETFGEFTPGNRITNSAGTVTGEIYNSFSGLTIVDGGSGYEVGDRIRLGGLSRITFEARVTRVSEDTGTIEEVTLIDFGSGTTPNFIRATQSSGQYFLDRFQIFTYLEDDRTLRLGDSEDISQDAVSGFSQDYVDGFYFTGSYGGTILFEEDTPNAVNNPLTVDFIQSSPTDPPQPLNYEIDTVNGTGAIFDVSFSALVRAAGFYENSRGQLSSNIVLQDSVFYQKFSYEIITANPINKWIDPFKKTIHPAGLAPFALMNQKEFIDVSSLVYQKDYIRRFASDEFSALEAAQIATTKPVSDSFTASSTFVLGAGKNIEDISNVSESISTIGFGKFLADLSPTTESIDTIDVGKGVDDSVTAPESIAVGFAKPETDSVTAPESIDTIDVGKAAVDSFTAPENIDIIDVGKGLDDSLITFSIPSLETGKAADDSFDPSEVTMQFVVQDYILDYFLEDYMGQSTLLTF